MFLVSSVAMQPVRMQIAIVKTGSVYVWAVDSE